MAADACARNVQELGRGAAVELRVRAQRHNNFCALLQRAGFICLCAHCDANAVDIGEECRHFDLALCVAAYNVLGVGCEGATESVQTVCMLRALGVFRACCVSESVKERCCKLTNFVHNVNAGAQAYCNMQTLPFVV